MRAKALSIREVLRRVTEAQEQCVGDWRAECRKAGGIPKGILQSRGKWLTANFIAMDGSKHVFCEGETRRWKESLIDMRDFLRNLLFVCEKHGTSIGGINRIVVFGGYDLAASMFARQQGEYDPLVCEWEVELNPHDIPEEWWAP